MTDNFDKKLTPYKEIVKNRVLEYYYGNKEAISQKRKEKYQQMPSEAKKKLVEYNKQWFNKQTPQRQREIKQKNCRRKYPLLPCTYCRLEFHILKKIKGEPVCSKCSQYLSQFGKPKNCKYCQLKAAFEKSCCARCISSEKKYGPPVECGRCKLQCAFNKSKEAQTKVGGQILCLQCTLEYKKIQRKQRKEKQIRGNSASIDDWHADISSQSNNEPIIAPLKAENLATKFKSSMDTIKPRSRENSRASSPFKSHDRNANETSHELSAYGDHMSEMTKLREEIAVLKKSLSLKEKVILDKDKKISELLAELWERDKLLKSKVQGIQKEYKDKIEELQLENGTLKKQIVTFKKKAKAKKTDRVYSKIRLEPHKLASLSAQSSPSSAYMQENKSDTEAVDFKSSADETVDEDEIKIPDESKKKPASPTIVSSIPSLPEPIQENVKQESKFEKSFDEAQEAEILKIMGPTESEENEEESTEKEGEVEIPKSKKRKKRKYLSDLPNEDSYASSGTDYRDDDEEDVVRIKKRKKKSNLIDDNDFGDIESPATSAAEKDENEKQDLGEEQEVMGNKGTDINLNESESEDKEEPQEKKDIDEDVEDSKESDSDGSNENAEVEKVEEEKKYAEKSEASTLEDIDEIMQGTDGETDEINQGTDGEADEIDEDEILDSQSD